MKQKRRRKNVLQASTFMHEYLKLIKEQERNQNKAKSQPKRKHEGKKRNKVESNSNNEMKNMKKYMFT